MASYVRSARISTTHACSAASTTQQIDLAAAGNVLGTFITHYLLGMRLSFNFVNV